MLKVLQGIIQEVNAARSLPEALQIVVERVCEVINVQACAVFLLHPELNRYLLIASQGYQAGFNGKLSMATHEGLIGLVGEREEPINLEDASSHPRYLLISDVGEQKYRAFLGVPIIHQRRVLGVLVVQQVAKRRFQAAEEALLVTISAQLSGLIAQAQAAGELTHMGEVRTQRDKRITGIPGVAGVGIGEAVVAYPLADLDAVPDKKIDDIDKEITLFNQALDLAREEIKTLRTRLVDSLPPQEQALFDAYLMILDDNSLGTEVITLIKQGQWAQGALKQVIKQHSHSYETMDDEYLRERGADVRDLGRRVLSYLQAAEREKITYPEKTILVGDEITAARLAEVPEGCLAGIVAAKGSTNSHVVIVARAMGIPAVVGTQGLSLRAIEATTVIVDGYHGVVYLSPSETLLTEFQRLEKEEQELSEGLAQLQDRPAETPDGHHLPLHVNTGLVSDIQLSLNVGAEGVGLYRSEVPFLVRDRFPSEAEQYEIYRQLLSAFAPRPVTMRTLDVGGDKTLPYFPVEEPNPFLGWRGIRITLDHPELFLVQLRAMLRASEGFNNLRIMLPMVSSLNEVIEAKAFLNQAYEELCEEGKDVNKPLLGAMIEVPSAVYQADLIAQAVDFLSVGSNDLIQYLLAVDRNNSRVANLYDGLHPAVLTAIQAVVDAAHGQGKTVSLCGEMAGDPSSVVLLLAMGFDSLSMSAASLPRVKWVIRNFNLSRAQALLAEVRTLDNPKVIRAHLDNALEQIGLGGLVRAGK